MMLINFAIFIAGAVVGIFTMAIMVAGSRE